MTWCLATFLQRANVDRSTPRPLSPNRFTPNPKGIEPELVQSFYTRMRERPIYGVTFWGTSRDNALI